MQQDITHVVHLLHATDRCHHVQGADGQGAAAKCYSSHRCPQQDPRGVRNVEVEVDGEGSVHQPQTDATIFKSIQVDRHQNWSSLLLRSHMHCDRVEDGSVDRLGDRLRRREHSSGQDEREARYWTKELYDFEANDPDRWGHSGFKELYPEEFKSDWERDRGDDQNGHCRKKKTKSRLKTAKSKHLKKSSKKKKKKKKKKEENRTGESDGESSSDSVKQKMKSNKSKHKRKKSEREEESSSEKRGRRRKRQMDSHRDSGPESHKKRKNWKAGADKSEDSSED
ncbi:NKAP domain containing 1 isoform X1 [Oncorhynchus tshawytscha]|uniref:NKAP domain containing 1 isoform X1 n=1 Tax=Oncorhynchus tshawytscha TaxID=74940 RepID=UPI000D098681|nr:NKAP domain containing 1 isoform X1 [Oncorhynchus tshawytscha]